MREDITKVKRYLIKKYGGRVYLSFKEVQKETLLCKSYIRAYIPKSGKFYHVEDVAKWIVKEYEKGNLCA